MSSTSRRGSTGRKPGTEFSRVDADPRRPPTSEQSDRQEAALTSSTVTVAPFGSWASPFRIERLTDRVVFLAEARGSGGVRWWLEGRPDEGGRQALIRRETGGTLTRLTPTGLNARSRVHEYGGGATLVSGDLTIVSDFTTGRLHIVVRPEELVALTPDRQWRFADMIHDERRNRLIAVREDHEPDV